LELCSPSMKWYTFWASRFRGWQLVHFRVVADYTRIYISLVTTLLHSQEDMPSLLRLHEEKIHHSLAKSVDSTSSLVRKRCIFLSCANSSSWEVGVAVYILCIAEIDS
jgi:hypothetical protein